MKIKWLGHSCFLLTGRDRVLVDPFLSGNEAAPMKPDEVECDIICVTHGHGDHLGDAVEIGKRTGANIVAIYEVATYVGQWTEAFGMNKGGVTKIKDTTIKMVNAIHSSGITASEFKHSGGEAAAFIIDTGKKVYHAGDTALFTDMQVIGEFDQPDIALLPIGDLYTMGPKEAAIAATWLRSKIVIPMHYDTWPKVNQDPKEFKQLVESMSDSKVMVLELGEEVEV